MSTNEKSSAVLTDAEIKKALECCITGDCQGCIYGETDQRHCRDDLMQNALDLINRQQAHIEQLKENIDGLKIGKANIINVIKSEAIKEFAERLKEKAKPHYFDNCNFAVPVDVINNLVKEMVGDAE